MCLSRSQSQFPKKKNLLVTKTWGGGMIVHTDPPPHLKSRGVPPPPPPRYLRPWPVHSLFPQTTLIIWSDIIPRVQYAEVSKWGQSKVDKTRRAANKYARSQTIRRGCSVRMDFICQTREIVYF